MTETEFYLASEVARLAGCSAQNIRELERRGKIKALKTEGGVRLFAGADVRKLVAEREREKRRADRG
jgi:DNA-binding transcriptional MerR regulator